MANFIKTTGLIQTADLVTKLPITPTRVATLTGWQADMDAAMAQWVVQGGIPPVDHDLWGAFDLEWLQTDIRTYVILGVPMVTRIGGMLAIDASIWETKAQHDAGDPPLIQETLERQQGESLAEVLKAFVDYLVRATVNGYSGDRRTSRASVTTDPAFDPRSILTRPQVQNLAGQVLNRP